MAFEGGEAAVDVGGASDLIGGAGASGGDGAGGAGAGAGDGAGAGGDGAGSGGDGTGAGGFTAPDWFEKISGTAAEGQTASNRDWLQSKGLTDLDKLVGSYREAEKAIRDGGKIKVPGEGAKPDEVAAYRTAIGVPEKPDGYEIKAVENGKFDPSRPEGPDNPKSIPLNDALIGSLRESALKHGTPKGAFEGLVGDFIQLQLQEAQAEEQKQSDLAAGWLKAQGAKADEQLAHVNQAARALQLSRTDMNGLRSGLGADRALALLAKLGAGMAEDTLITGGSNRFGVSGAEAQAELDRLKTDKDFMAKVMIPGSPERTRWERLNRTAAEYHAAKENG